MDDSNPSTYNHATHFSYDIHGNVNTLIQDNPSLHDIYTGSGDSMQYKRIDYSYDLVSGNVNQVSYQSGQPDQFYHRYNYDADNRITKVFTSKDNILFDTDAKYFYYAHGPLARTELGDNQVQGMDYAYTLQGWVKAVNSNLLKVNNDMGHDGSSAGSDTINKRFAHDAFGYSLNYFDKDYSPIGTLAGLDSALASLAGSDVLKARHELFNGNISSMVTTISKPTVYTATIGTATILPQATAYKYDQLNRIVEMQAYQNINTATNAWESGSTYAGMYNNKFIYDANGNILMQLRKDSASNAIDSLVYRYAKQNGRTIQNRLYHVNDVVASTYSSTDIDDQGTYDSTLVTINTHNNYGYDEIGNLNRDSTEQIDTIKWSVYGKIKEVIRTSGSAKKNLKFDYDASGNRIAKHVYTSAGVFEHSDYYVRDAQGNIMSIYTDKPSVGSFLLKERNIFGSSMVGTDYDTLQMIGATVSADTAVRYLGNKHFFGQNHLGNVLAVVSDKKIARGSGTTLYNYEPEILSAVDYSAFGVELSGRTFNQGASRYGFGAQEKDDEVSGSGNSYTAEFWDYDPRTGRRKNLDPVIKQRPWESGYSVMGNNPIWNKDPNGDDFVNVHTKRKAKAKDDLNEAESNLEKATNNFKKFEGLNKDGVKLLSKEERKEYKSLKDKVEKATTKFSIAKQTFENEVRFEKIVEKVLKEFQNTNSEFYDFWDKYDPYDNGVINIDVAVQDEGIRMKNEEGAFVGNSVEGVSAVIDPTSSKNSFVKIRLQVVTQNDGSIKIEAMAGVFVHGLGHVAHGKNEDKANSYEARWYWNKKNKAK